MQRALFSDKAGQTETLPLASHAGLGDDDMPPLTILGTLRSLGNHSVDETLFWRIWHRYTVNNLVALVSGGFPVAEFCECGVAAVCSGGFLTLQERCFLSILYQV